MDSNDFVDLLVSLRMKNTFNPYGENCEIFDKKNAAKIRTRVLREMLGKAETAGVDSLWIGRDLGHRGGRRTGLALTDEANVDNHVRRWNMKMERITKGDPVSERTAAVMWEALNLIHENIFLWNVFPLHPYMEGFQFTNRSHTASERVIGEEILANLIEIIRPKRILAVGNDAFASAKKLKLEVPLHHLRHPSYGGQNIFLTQVQSIYNIDYKRNDRQPELF